MFVKKLPLLTTVTDKSFFFDLIQDLCKINSFVRKKNQNKIIELFELASTCVVLLAALKNQQMRETTGETMEKKQRPSQKSGSSAIYPTFRLCARFCYCSVKNSNT